MREKKPWYVSMKGVMPKTKAVEMLKIYLGFLEGENLGSRKVSVDLSMVEIKRPVGLRLRK